MMSSTKTLFVAIALCLFLTGCYVVRHGGQDNPYTDGQIHYYYLKYDFYYYPDAGNGRWRDDGKLWDDFEGVVSDEDRPQNRMASRAYPEDAEIRAE